MRLSTVILPVHSWQPEGRRIWRRAEDLGFHAAYTYDHLSWRVPFRDGPWFGAVPTLAAAAEATDRIRLGTMVTSPNFRHPVTLAKELMTLDHASGGRITVGVGAGGSGFDATTLHAPGEEAWTPRERADRFGEFLPLLDELLRNPATTREGRYYSANGARMIPGCVQRPRLPLTVAATGPRGLKLAVAHGDGWVTTGSDLRTGEVGPQVVAEQLDRLRTACEDAGRDPASIHRVLLTGFTDEPLLESVEAYRAAAGAYAELGIDEIILHWPLPGTQFEADQEVFEAIAAETAAA